MYYITTRLAPQTHQMTLDDLLSFDYNAYGMSGTNTPNTRTDEVEEISDKWKRAANVQGLTNVLRQFNESVDYLRTVDRHSLYKSFSIPKKSGGYRKIDAPEAELKVALSNLKLILETSFKALYHTSAFAYIHDRSTLDCVKRHQRNNSRWFEKDDLSNFFGSTTLEFVMKMLSKIYPFCEVIKDDIGREELEKALELGFLDGVLPQGTPLSPTLTNIIMIPLDFTISKKLRAIENQSFVYTRYADDFFISNRYNFDPAMVRGIIRDTLNEFEAPYVFKEEKSRYGSSSGRNWMLGLMLNKDNNITVGYKNKKYFKAAVQSYAQDKANGKHWNLDDLRTLEGKRSYYTHIEGETIIDIVKKIGAKYNMDIEKSIKEDLAEFTSAEVIYCE